MASETKHQKYRDALTKAALGELSGRREAELLAHTAECDACHEEYVRARELREMVDRAVSGVVAGEPSAGFEARLRARLADAPAPARWRAAWAPAAAGACALAGLLLMIAIRAPRQRPSQNGTEAAITTANSAGPAVWSKPAGTASLRECRSGQGCAPTPERPKRGEAVAMARRLRRHTKRAMRHSELEVIVPREQIEAFAEFAESAEKWQVHAGQLAAVQAASQKPIEIARTEIKEIEIPPLDFDQQLKPVPVPEMAFLPIAP